MNRLVVNIYYVALAAASLLSACSSRQSVTMESLLNEMVSRDALTYFPDYTQKQISSCDRRSVSPDAEGWFANRDWTGYERIDTIAGRIEKVMMEYEGPGAIDRIWMTTRGKRGTMRFYFDGAEEPAIVIPAYDMKKFPLDIPAALSLTHTHYETELDGIGGNTFFLPIPFAKGCRVTFETETPLAEGQRYYQINWRAYAQGTKVRTYTQAEAEKLLPKIREVSDLLLHPIAPEGSHLTGHATLAKGETLNIALHEGTNAVRGIKVSLPNCDNYAKAMESLCIEGTFDDVKCIDRTCLAGFFGAGFGAPEVNGWWLKNKTGEAECRWVMPYRQNGQIVIFNGGEEPVNVSVDITAGKYDWQKNSLYFHCSNHSECGIPTGNQYDSNDNLDWNFTTIKGRGVYCGDLLSLYNYGVDWYGEGDEKIWIDDDAFPSFFGTGVEDYYNCSWAPVVPFLTPYGGAPRADSESSHGFNAYMRTRNLDLIPFKDSLRYDIEMLSWTPGSVDYHTVSWWYGDKNTVTK